MVGCTVNLRAHFGYSPNATKTILVVKDEHEQTANSLFSDTGIKITTHGKRHLGAAIGSSAFAEEYVRGKVVEWTEEVESIAIIAVSQPQAAHAAFVHGSRNKWTYLLRIINSTVWSMPLASGGCHPPNVHPCTDWTIALLGSGKSTTGPPGKTGGNGSCEPSRSARP